jgi:hypothetical protein
MRGVVDYLLVGRAPLGSAVRAVLLTILLTLFWTLFITQRWQLFTVSLITALAVVVAAHLFSKRDDALSGPEIS